MPEELPNVEVSIPKAIKRRPQKISLVPQGFRLTISPSEAREEREEVYAGRNKSFSSAIDRVAGLNTAFDLDRSRRTTALVASSGSALATVFELDPLEEYRAQTGRTEEREQLMIELHKAYSFEKGLRLLNDAVGHEKYHSMQEVNQDFPNITKYEMVLFSLLRSFPRLYLATGLSTPRHPKTEEEILQSSIPNVVGVTIDGLELATDFSEIRQFEESDIYQNLGITAVQELSSSSEFVDFRDDVKKNLRKLIPLTIKSQRLFERLWERFDIALQDGFVKMDRVAAEKVLGKTLSKGISQKDINQMFNDEQEKEWEQEKKIFDEKIAKCIIINPLTQEVFRTQDIIKLIGLLKKFPEFLVGDKPFEGYVVPMGTGVLFVDHASEQRHFFSFYPYYIREALQGISQEAIDPTKYNQVLNAIFHEITNSIRPKVLAEVEQTGEDPSLIEGKFIDLIVRYGIDVNPNSFFDINKSDDWHDVWVSRTGKRHIGEVLYKFGSDELENIAHLLRLVPDQMLKEIKRIRKRIRSTADLTAYLEGTIELGHYNRVTKTIVLDQIEGKPYASLKPEEKAICAFTLLHEIGHGTWYNLEENLQNEWYSFLPDQGKGTTKNPDDFLTWYSKISPEEDFSESLAAYILHGQDFRDAAEKNNVIAKKYHFIKKLFQHFTGEDREYPQIIPFSLAQVHAFNEIHKHSLDEAINEFFKREAEDDISIQERTARISKTLDAKVEDVLEKDDPELNKLIDETISERVDSELQIAYKRTMVNEFRDYFANSSDESQAIKRANRLYSMIEEGETDNAIKFALTLIDELDEEEMGELVQLIKKITEDIDTGKDRAEIDTIYR